MAFFLTLAIIIGASIVVAPASAQEGWFKLPFAGVVSGSRPVGVANPARTNGAAVMEQLRATNMGQEFKAARVLWLDKQTNRRQTLVLQADVAQDVGITTTNGSPLSLKMVRCLADYGAMGGQVLGQDVAWLEVREKGREVPWFAGWMFNTYPEVATLDHPRYHLQVLGCGEQPRKRGGMLRPQSAASGAGAGDARDSEAPGQDSEAPSDDPFYVPGVAPAEVEPQAGPVPAAPASALHELMDGR